MLLTENEAIQRDVFVDSDNLTHLDVLFDTLARDVPAATRPLGLPPYRVGSEIAAASVRRVGSSAFVYEFSVLLVMMAQSTLRRKTKVVRVTWTF